MANEITINFNLSHTKEPKRAIQANQIQIDQTGIGVYDSTVSVGTSEEVLSFGDITTEGLVVLKNLDDTNFVTVGPESAGAMVGLLKVEPGEVQFFRLLPTATVRAQADTAAVKLQVTVFED